VLAHIAAVLAAVPDTPVVLQYAPAQTGTALDAAGIGALARAHPNLHLVKVESSPPGALIAAPAAGDPPLPSLVGAAGLYLPDAVAHGAAGVQPGCSFAEVYVKIWQRYERGDAAGGDDLHSRLVPYLSSWMADVELIIAAEKLISVRRGLITNARCRAPRRELDALEVSTVDRFVSEFAQWLS
jgi:dihydrodipicolinate synthase/N-acetylneuraminate lyase